MPPAKKTSNAKSGIRVETFLLCDVARIQHGKLYIIGGGWERLAVKEIPTKSEFDIAIRILVPRSMLAKPLELKVSFTDDAGDIEGDSDTVKMEMPAQTPANVDLLALNYCFHAEMTFGKFGTFGCNMEANGKLVDRIEFHIVSRSEAAAEIARLG
ncbi:MAG: hypothetical protein KDA90_21135 [Planctomycetaceae bacterium]|nr:hypothetical protein [Planctomycetaceae bacterium]